MSQSEVPITHRNAAMREWFRLESIGMLFLGFSAGLPILLIFSTLSVWLTEAGVARSAVTFFSWAALGYSFKFLWAPLLDLLPLPLLTAWLGRRRGWLLVSQLSVITAILFMAATDPSGGESGLTMMALAAVMLGFSSATQDIVIDAYRIECAKKSLQALLASMYIAGYRGGMLVAGAGSLFIAGYLGTSTANYSYPAWRLTYVLMAATMLLGVATTLILPEPKQAGARIKRTHSNGDYLRFFLLFCAAAAGFGLSFFYTGDLVATVAASISGSGLPAGGYVTFLCEIFRFLCAVASGCLLIFIGVNSGFANKSMAVTAYVDPVREFFHRYGIQTASLLLLLIGFYRLSDIVLGVVANVFYLDLGFSKNAIAGITKTFGLVMTLAGGFMGGFLTLRFGIGPILMLGALLSAATNLLFMLLAASGPDITLLTVVIAADNLAAGIATTAFVAFLSSLTCISFTAVQYAIFSSIMTLMPKLLGGYSGTMVTEFGYERFFLLTTLMGIPVVILIMAVQKIAPPGSQK